MQVIVPPTRRGHWNLYFDDGCLEHKKVRVSSRFLPSLLFCLSPSHPLGEEGDRRSIPIGGIGS